MSKYVFDESIKLAENAMLKARPELFDEWDFEKNNELGLDIYKVTKGSGKSAWWICKKCNNQHKSLIFNKLSAEGCNKCPKRKVIRGVNDLCSTHPNIAKLLLKKELGHEVSHGSRDKVDWKCSHCGNILKQIIANVCRRGLYCRLCADGISYSEKIITNILVQLKSDFEVEKSFDWSKGKRYDFYLPKIKVIIESHGSQHYIQQGREKGKTLIEEQRNDKIKEELARENGIENYIVIDSRFSNLEFIKNNILNSKLISFFDMKTVDWEQANVYATSSIAKKACELFNKYSYLGFKCIKKELNIGSTALRSYLNRGAENGWCDYNPKKAMRMIGENNKPSNNRIVIQLDLNGFYVGEFKSITDAGKKIQRTPSNISSCCKGKRKKVGGYKWMYKEDYENMIKENNMQKENLL